LFQVVLQAEPSGTAYKSAYRGETLQLHHVSKDFPHISRSEEAFDYFGCEAGGWD